MMNKDIAIKVENLSKVYKLYSAPIDRMKEALHPFKKNYHKEFYALNEVGFEIKKGQTVGIIGKNGSGKSTLLKIITGVLTPTTGKVTVNGRISALLELGAGFNPEYTGMENIYFQGNLMGFEREDMEAKVQEILDFADIGAFIDQPVKNYSSGMFARLAFAVAINVEPEILIVDEALSVGDMFFQAKCYNKFHDLQSRGVTILFVTHDMGSIIKYCQFGILINCGKVIGTGTPNEAVDLYKKIMTNSQQFQVTENSESHKIVKQQLCVNWKNKVTVNPSADFYGNGDADVIDFGTFDLENKINNTFLQGEDIIFKFRVKFNNSVVNPIFAFGFKDVKGNEILGSNTLLENIVTDNFNQGDIVEVGFSVRNILRAGSYMVSCACTGEKSGEFIVYARAYNIFAFDSISERATVGFVQPYANVHINKF